MQAPREPSGVHAIKVRGAGEAFSAKNVAEDPTSGGEKEPDYSTL